MAVYYKVYQDNRKLNPHKGSWYGRAAMTDTDTTDDLAKAIEEKCTVNEADVLAVIRALVGEITKSLQASHRVKLPGFGTFKLGMTSAPAASRDKFSAANIKDVHVLFQPEVKINRTTGTRTRTFLTGTRVKELPPYIGAETAGGQPTKPGKDSGSDAGKDAGAQTGKDSGSQSGQSGQSGQTGQSGQSGDKSGGEDF